MEGVNIGGVPVEPLTGELARVWSGWRASGDREVVREASAKGLHINLAYKFLANRRGCSIEEAKSYFSSEVEIWVNELLNKRQVHRASHVLKNVVSNFITEKSRLSSILIKKCIDYFQNTQPGIQY